MNKLLTNFNRGFSLKSNDFRWIDDSVRLALADICKSMGITGPVVLWGCGVTYAGATATVTEGAIFFQNEIWHVEPHTFTVHDPMVSSPNWCFPLTYHPDGAKLDKDLVNHQTYQIRRAIGAQVSIPFPAETISMDDVPRLDNNYSTAALSIEAGITSIGDSTVIKSGRLAFIEVSVRVNVSSADNTLIATIPAGYRPGRTIRGVCMMAAATATSKVIASWFITDAGLVYIDRMGTDTGSWNIHFSSELFRIV